MSALVLLAAGICGPLQLPGEPWVSSPCVCRADLLCFPPAKIVDDALKTANAHIAWLQEQRKFRQHDDDGGWFDSADNCRWCWRHLSYALWYRDAIQDDAHMRRNLMFLRMRLGNEAYYSGRMPPPVPTWRFREIR